MLYVLNIVVFILFYFYFIYSIFTALVKTQVSIYIKKIIAVGKD